MPAYCISDPDSFDRDAYIVIIIIICSQFDRAIVHGVFR